MKHLVSQRAIQLLLILCGFFPKITLAADESLRSAKLTDLAALHTQDRSITKLQSLLKQYRGTPQEPEFLSRLADLYLQRSGISFRISEGSSVKKNSAIYTGSLKDSIRAYSELIQKYPTHSSMANAHFKRGKAYKELGQIKEAKADYLYIDQHFSDFEYLDSCLIDLTDFAQEANQHKEALGYLAELEKMTSSDYYSIGLHKTAWSYFNLTLYTSAIEYLKKEINFYFDRIDVKKTDIGAETAFLENAFNDLALFSFETYNKKVGGKVEDTLKLFQSLDRNHHFYGPTVLKFSRLLKAYTLIPELESLKKTLMTNQIELPETSEVALLQFQHYFEKREYNQLPSVLADLNKIRAKIRNKDLDQKVETALSGALTDLHKMVLRNKMATEVGTLFRPLISLTESVSDLLGNDNATALLANYSLAETSFELQDYPRATQKYLDLLNPAYTATLQAKKVTRYSLALRLLSSRYRELKNDHLIPEHLLVRPISAKASPTSKDQLEKIKQWNTWVNQYSLELSATTPVEDRQSFFSFELESNKLTYEFLDEASALVLFEKFAFAHPDTQEGQISISVVLDTLLKSEDWTRLYELSHRVLKVKTWSEKDFAHKVTELAASSHLKITLLADQPEIVLKRSQECIEDFKHSSVAQECQIIHAKTELKLGKVKEAEEELSSLLKTIKEPAKVQSMLLLRAGARNQLGRMTDAIHDITEYQTMTDFNDGEITNQLLQYYWFKHDQVRLESLLKNKKACSGKNAETCEQYQVVKILDRPSSKSNYLSLFRSTTKAPKSLVSIYAMAALEDAKKLPFQDRLILLQRLASSWEHLNPLLQVHLVPLLHSRVNESLESIRVSAPGIAPLSADPASIEKRMRLMQDVDQTFAKVMKLNWLEIKMNGAHELGQIYDRLVKDLRSIQTPENLLKPFEQKKKEIADAVVQLQSMAVYFSPVAPSVSETQAPQGGVAPASVSDKAVTVTHAPITAQSLLVSSEIKNRVPTHLWTEWTSAVDSQRRDYLFYLTSIIEQTNPDFKTISPLVRGLVVLSGNAPTEAFEMIKAAPESPWKTVLSAQFKPGQKTGESQ